MKGFGLIKQAVVIATLCAFGSPQAEAIEIFAGPSPAAHMNDDVLTQVMGGGGHRHAGAGGHRGGGGMHRGGGHNFNHNVNRNFNHNVSRNVNRNVNVVHVNRGYGYRGGAWVGRPGWYRWPAGGAIAAGAAIGFVSAAAAASWAGAPPASGLCWYYTDPSRQQGFWDQCP